MAALLACMMASACAVKQPVAEVDPIAEQLEKYIAADSGDVRHEVSDENVARLWQETEILRRTGDIENARGRLQQAIEFTPRDPVLWSRAAEFELELNSHLRAENYAAKSNFLAALGNKPLRYRNWLIIQRAREGRGDLLGAREAALESAKITP